VEDAWELAALVMSDADEIEVSAGDKGLAVKAKGGAATRLGHGFADALRFFSSPLGLVADEVDRFRIYRQVAFEEILLKAHGIAIGRNIENSNAPLKFIAQWSESASLENMDDPENLSDLWANLLVLESSQSEPNSLIFVDILKKIRKPHADLLKRLFDGRTGMSPAEIINYSAVNVIEEVIYSNLRIHNFPTDDTDKQHQIIDSIYNELLLPGVYVFHCSIYRKTTIRDFGECASPELDIDFNTTKGMFSSSIAESLKSLGLLRDIDLKFDWGEDEPIFEVSLYGYGLTKLGWDFVFSCGVVSREELKKND